MRDYIAAIQDRVVVFDGSMGATLEQYELSLEHDYKLPGRAHEALVLNRPDVIAELHASMIDAGAEVVETDTFQASRLKLEEWGLDDHTYEINRKAAEIARGGDRGAPLRRRLDRPDRAAAGLRRPDARADPLPRARGDLRGAGARARRRRRRPADHRDRPGHPGGQGRRLRRPRGVQADRPRRAAPDVGLAAAQRRHDAARHGHQRRAGDARGAQGRRDRPQLLDRPRGHARRDPLPGRVLARAGPVHPERRHPAPGPERRDDLPRGARAAGGHAGRVRRPLRRVDRRRLLRHDHGAHRGDRRARRRRQGARRAPRRARPTCPR